MDKHLLVIYILKTIVAIFSSIAFSASILLAFSKKLFLKLNQYLIKNNDYENVQYISENNKGNLLKNFKILGVLVLLISIYCFNKIQTSFNTKEISEIFSDIIKNKTISEITFQFIKYFLLTTLLISITASILMIISPKLFKKIDFLLKKQYKISQTSHKNYDIDKFILQNHFLMGLSLSLLSAYILYFAIFKLK